MTPPLDRRRSARRAPEACEPIARLRLRTGRELCVIDVAATGALVETEGRLLPGTCVDVHVMTVDGRELVRSRVVRAFVWTLSADRIRYRGALAFERRVEIGAGIGATDAGTGATGAGLGVGTSTGYPIPLVAGDACAPAGMAYPLASAPAATRA